MSVLTWMLDKWVCISHVALFPGLPHLWALVCIDNNIRKWKSGEEQGRTGRIHQWMTSGGHKVDVGPGGGEGGGCSRFSLSLICSSSSRLGLSTSFRFESLDTVDNSHQSCLNLLVVGPRPPTSTRYHSHDEFSISVYYCECKT